MPDSSLAPSDPIGDLAAALSAHFSVPLEESDPFGTRAGLAGLICPIGHDLCSDRPCEQEPVPGGATTQLVVRSRSAAPSPVAPVAPAHKRLGRHQRPTRPAPVDRVGEPREHVTVTVFGFPTDQCRACGTQSQDLALCVAATCIIEARLQRGEDFLIGTGIAFSALELEELAPQTAPAMRPPSARRGHHERPAPSISRSHHPHP